MLELNARDFIELIHDLLASEHAIRGKSGELTPMLAAHRDQANGKVIALLKKLELPVSVKTAEEMTAGAKTIERLHESLEPQIVGSIRSADHGAARCRCRGAGDLLLLL